jgi:predicted HTH transcriptional regulator
MGSSIKKNKTLKKFMKDASLHNSRGRGFDPMVRSAFLRLRGQMSNPRLYTNPRSYRRR